MVPKRRTLPCRTRTVNADYFITKFIIPEMVYTLIIALVIYYPLMKLDTLLDVKWKKRKKGNLDEGNI